MSITLTAGQLAAYNAFDQFISDPHQTVLSISGYAGTGKSTLIQKIRQDLNKMLQVNKAITQEERDWNVVLTATTNKACEAFSKATGEDVQTIHTFLGLIVRTDYKTKTTTLETTKRTTVKRDYIIFIDEASYIDHVLLEYIFEYCVNCKIVFIGDPAQLAPVKSRGTPVYDQGFKEARLTEVVRQANGNPIIDLATAFRDTVNGQGWLEQFVPDGHHIQYLPRDQFNQAVLQEFNRSDWSHDDSKVLAYTNKTVQAFNRSIRDVVQGTPQLEKGDYALVNSALHNNVCKLRTDQMVMISNMMPTTQLGVKGWAVVLDDKHRAFLPESLEAKKARIKQANKDDDLHVVAQIDQTWIDLRAAYACTINKSQGSTYDKVFIDLDDVRRCTNPNTVARLLYVGVSRARHHVILTGDIVAQEANDAALPKTA